MSTAWFMKARVKARVLMHLTADTAITYAKAWMGEENDL